MRPEAQSVVEYGLLIATVAILVLIGASSFGEVLRQWLASVMDTITRTGT